MRTLLRLEHWFNRNYVNRRYWLALLYHLTLWRRRHRTTWRCR